MARRHHLRTKRVYEPASDEDGQRVLVDRLWPRGLGKDEARLDLWLKEIAPSAELRKWFHHEAGEWEAFVGRYRAELRENDAAVRRLQELMDKGPVTLLYGARDTEHNHAHVIEDFMASKET